MLGLDPGEDFITHSRPLTPGWSFLAWVLELSLVWVLTLAGVRLITPHDYELEFIISWWIVH